MKKTKEIEVIDFTSNYGGEQDLTPLFWIKFEAGGEVFQLALFQGVALSCLHQAGVIEIGKFLDTHPTKNSRVELFGGYSNPHGEWIEVKTTPYVADLLKDLIDSETTEKIIRVVYESEILRPYIIPLQNAVEIELINQVALEAA